MFDPWGTPQGKFTTLYFEVYRFCFFRKGNIEMNLKQVPLIPYFSSFEFKIL